MLVFALRRIGMRKIRERTPADADEVVGDNYSQADEGGQALSPIESRKFLYAELSRVGSARLRRERPNDRANLLLRHVERTPRHLGSVISAPWAAMMSKRVKGAGLVTTDRLFGLSWSGAMTEERMTGLIKSLPPGRTEIYTHPATSAGYEGAAHGYRYTEELAALVSQRCREAIEESKAVLGGYGDLIA
jgi:hypothetical protein